MPGGIGPVSRAVINAGSKGARERVAFKNTNDIFYHLDSNCVYYDRTCLALYFVNSCDGAISRTIRSVLSGLGNEAAFEQLHLDQHKLFSAACCIRLTDEQLVPVLIALKLGGVGILYQERAIKSAFKSG
jgi:hypothetical protein